MGDDVVIYGGEINAGDIRFKRGNKFHVGGVAALLIEIVDCHIGVDIIVLLCVQVDLIVCIVAADDLVNGKHICIRDRVVRSDRSGATGRLARFVKGDERVAQLRGNFENLRIFRAGFRKLRHRSEIRVIFIVALALIVGNGRQLFWQPLVERRDIARIVHALRVIRSLRLCTGIGGRGFRKWILRNRRFAHHFDEIAQHHADRIGAEAHECGGNAVEIHPRERVRFGIIRYISVQCRNRRRIFGEIKVCAEL